MKKEKKKKKKDEAREKVEFHIPKLLPWEMRIQKVFAVIQHWLSVKLS